MIFIDSSVLVAYWVVDDSNHDKAVKIIQKISENQFGDIFTSDYIFDEVLAATMVKAKSLHNAILAGNYLREATEILKLDESEFEGAWKFFKEQKGTRFSFTDCTIISLMSERNISTLATFDAEFKKVKSLNVVS